MKKFWSSRLADVTPYIPGEQPRNQDLIKLNTNENPYPPSPRVLPAIQKAADNLRLYPDPEGTPLRDALARRYGVEPGQIFLGNGSDEVLAFAFQAFFDGQPPILFPDITYSFYPVYASFFNIPYRMVPLREDFTLRTEDFLTENGGVVIANPNAPTGISIPMSRTEIARIVEGNPMSVVLVDEAYVDFGGESVVPLVHRYPNLLVVQTMSKSRSLAGLRVGFAFGDENLIAALNCVKNSINSYTLDRLAIAGAAASVEDEDYFRSCCAKVVATRERTAERLEQLDFRVLPSKSNFLFVSHGKQPAQKLFARLRQEGILVRYFNTLGIDNFLRISIGTDEEMDTLCGVLSRILKED